MRYCLKKEGGRKGRGEERKLGGGALWELQGDQSSLLITEGAPLTLRESTVCEEWFCFPRRAAEGSGTSEEGPGQRLIQN